MHLVFSLHLLPQVFLQALQSSLSPPLKNWPLELFQVYRLADDQILLPGLYPLEERHHLERDPVAPFDSVQDLPAFQRSLTKDFWRGGKYTRSDKYRMDEKPKTRVNQGFLYSSPPEDPGEENSQLLFDSIESSQSDGTREGRPLWTRLLCCVSCKGKAPESGMCRHVRVRADSW